MSLNKESKTVINRNVHSVFFPQRKPVELSNKKVAANGAYLTLADFANVFRGVVNACEEDDSVCDSIAYNDEPAYLTLADLQADASLPSTNCETILNRSDGATDYTAIDNFNPDAYLEEK